MSEQAPKKTEALLPTAEHAEVTLPTPEQAEPLRPGEKIQNVEQARSSVEKNLGKDQSEARAALAGAERPAGPVPASQISRELRQASLARELGEIRRRLPAPQRALSRVIHQPTVRIVSEAAGRSVSRPSGLLGGGLVAFLGSSAYLYLAKQQDFRYNYLVFLVLLAGGFVLGLVLEAIVYLFSRSRRQQD